MRRWAGRVAYGLGVALRGAGRHGPGVAGPVLVWVGLWMVWPPAGVVAAGATLWAWDVVRGLPPRAGGEDRP